MSEYDEQLAELESELWAALAALEQQNLVVVRQCLDRAKITTVEAWRSFKQEVGEVQ